MFAVANYRLRNFCVAKIIAQREKAIVRLTPIFGTCDRDYHGRTLHK